jgi:hypothetical protein
MGQFRLRKIGPILRHFDSKTTVGLQPMQTKTVLITGDRSSPATWAMTKEHLESSSTSEARVGRPADKTLSSHNPCYAKSSLTIEKL